MFMGTTGKPASEKAAEIEGAQADDAAINAGAKVAPPPPNEPFTVPNGGTLVNVGPADADGTTTAGTQVTTDNLTAVGPLASLTVGTAKLTRTYDAFGLSTNGNHTLLTIG